jgi:hypothetical protein
MGHWALGMGHGALGIGHGASGIGYEKKQKTNNQSLMTAD